MPLERQKHPAFKRSLGVVRDKVKSGIALSEAFRDEGALYPPMLSASLIAGERSGNLEGVLRRFVQYVRLSLSLKKKAVAAAVYPIMLLVMMLVLGGIMEQSFRQAMTISGGNPKVFVGSTICIVLVVMSVFSIFLPLILKRIEAMGKGAKSA